MPYYLRFLGQPQLLLPNGEESRFRVRKHLALLLYLAAEARGVPHRRERLAEFLWPNVTAGEGRHSLATALSVLRGKLGRESLETDRDHVRFSPSDFALDLDRLTDGTVLGDDYTPPLVIAGFLEEFEIPDAPEFQLWRERQWARWLPGVRDALRLLIDRCRRTGAFREMDRHAECLLGLDELSEEGIRARMEARAFEGDRLSALKLYEQWRARLAEELQAEPSPELEQMAARLRRRGWERVPSGESPAIRTEQWRGRLFLGRTREYQQLYELWEETRRGNPSHALVLGDSGVGKSTLLGRVMTAAELEGAAVSRVQCYELEQEIPYAGLGSLIEGLLRLPGVAGTAPEWLAELARLQPEVRRRFPGIPEPPESLGETARLRLAEAAFQLLTTLAEDLPVILVLDDLHLADDATLAVLHLVLRRLDRQRIMMLAAGRPAELDRSPNAVRLREGGSGIRMTSLDLPPMSEDESAALLAALVGDDPAPPLVARRAILSAAAGYPMVLEHLVRDWQANGDGALALSLGAMTEDLSPGKRAGDAYRLILERLLRELPASARTALGLAALLGSRLNDLDMYALADLALSETMSSLARLTDLRVLRDGSRGLEFSNELVRAEAYLAVPSPLRRTLHGNIADRLLALKDQAVPGLEIAWHCMRAGRTEQATPYLLAGAREAIRQGAPLEAERALTSAFNSLKGETQEEARLIWAEALQEQGRWEESLEVLGEPTKLRERNAELAILMLGEARRQSRNTSSDESLELLLRLEKLARNSTDPNIRVRALGHAAALRTMREDYTLDKDLLEILRTAADEDLDLLTAAQRALVIAQLAYRTPEGLEALQVLRDQIVKLEDEQINSSVTSRLNNALGCMLCNRGEYESALHPFEKAYELAVALGHEGQQEVCSANLALCNFRLGDYEEQARWVAELMRRPSMNHDGHFLSQYLNYAWSLALRGRRSEAAALLEKRHRELAAMTIPAMQQLVGLRTADVYRALGNTEASLAVAEEALGRQGNQLAYAAIAGSFARHTAFVGTYQGREREARTIIDSLLSRIHEFDTLDRAEILAASLWLNGEQGEKRVEQTEELYRILEALPGPCLVQIESLGQSPPFEVAP